jgi:hypothetical protein
MPTETIGPKFVTNGETTSEDISQPDGEINILSSQIRWRGNNRTEETTTTRTEYRNNSDDFGNATATGDGTEYVLNVDVPTNTPSSCNNAEFENHGGYLSKQEGSDITDVRVVYARLYESDGTINDEKTNFTTSPNNSIFDFSNEHVDEPFNQLSSGAYVEMKIDTDYSGAVVADNELDELSVYARSEWSCSTTTSTTYSTKDTSVSGDVSGSYSGTLSDGEWSPWQTLNGLDPNQVEDFNHSIGGSNEADFEVEYEWEYALPTALKELRFYDEESDTIEIVALADVDDGGLDYNSIRTSVNGTTYAIDFVEPTTTGALERYTLYHPVHGELSPRLHDTK